MDMPEIANQLKPKQVERFKTKLGKQAGRMMEQHIAFSVSFVYIKVKTSFYQGSRDRCPRFSV